MAILQKADGTTEKITPHDGVAFTLEEMQQLVAGGQNIEMMRLSDDCILIIDEEGKLKELPYNENATNTVKAHADIDSFGAPGEYSKDLEQPRDFIVGDALVCNAREAGEDEEAE